MSENETACGVHAQRPWWRDGHCICAELAAAEERGRRWKEKEMETLRGAVTLANEEIRRLVAAAHDSEERGRRRGVEEAADKAYTAAHEAAEEIWKLHGGVQQAPCYQAAVASLRTIRKIESDLAPRDSAPDLVVCDYCPEHPHPLNDDGTKCVHPRAPRDSGKGAK